MLSDPSFTKSMASIAMVGWVLVVGVVVGTLAGRYLDGKLDSSPWLLLSGAAIGLTCGLLYIWKTVTRNAP